MPVEKNAFSIFLIKTTAQTAAQTALSAFENARPLIEGLEGSFIPMPAPARPPKWLTGVRSLVTQPNDIVLTSQSAGGMLLIKRAQFLFAVTFGHGWLQLEDDWLEPDFGRKVALNLINRRSVVGLSAEQVFAKWHVSTERAPRTSAFEEFSVETDRDLVSAIEGKPSDSLFGDLIRGSTSLRVTIPIGDLLKLLDEARKLFQNGAYQKIWPEIDNLRPIRNEDLISQLNNELDITLSKPHPESQVVLFIPSARKTDTQIAESYVVGRWTANPALNPYVTFQSWASYQKSKGKPLTVAEASAATIHFVDGTSEPIGKCKVYDCLGYEASLSGTQYILSSGIWYEAVKKFITDINDSVYGLTPPSVGLHAWDRKVREGPYNESCTKRNSSILLFDKKLISFGGGSSRFEFCDLMHPDKKILYFVKIASRSSDLSHLVEQVRRTVELLFHPDDGFRIKLKKKVKDVYPGYKTTWLDKRPRAGDWDLCLVSLGMDQTQLPMFAKCALSRLRKELVMGGHKVSFLAP